MRDMQAPGRAIGPMAPAPGDAIIILGPDRKWAAEELPPQGTGQLGLPALIHPLGQKGSVAGLVASLGSPPKRRFPPHPPDTQPTGRERNWRLGQASKGNGFLYQLTPATPRGHPGRLMGRWKPKEVGHWLIPSLGQGSIQMSRPNINPWPLSTGAHPGHTPLSHAPSLCMSLRIKFSRTGREGS